jgi:hypothetical protein
LFGVIIILFFLKVTEGNSMKFLIFLRTIVLAFFFVQSFVLKWFPVPFIHPFVLQSPRSSRSSLTLRSLTFSKRPLLRTSATASLVFRVEVRLSPSCCPRQQHEVPAHPLQPGCPTPSPSVSRLTLMYPSLCARTSGYCKPPCAGPAEETFPLIVLRWGLASRSGRRHGPSKLRIGLSEVKRSACSINGAHLLSFLK